MRSRLESALRRAVIAILISTQLGAQASIDVGRNVHVSAARPDVVHEEVTIAPDPNNASQLLVCVNGKRRDHDKPFDMLYRSADSGRSWNLVMDLQDTASADLDLPWTVDVDCVFGPNGEAYFSAMSNKPKHGGRPEAYVFRSPDGGKTWMPRTVHTAALDRQALAVDRSSGPYHGRVYLTYSTRFISLETDADLGREHDKTPALGIAVEVSTDGGKAFARTVERYAVPGSEVIYPSTYYNVVLSDGTLLIPVKYPKGTSGYSEASYKLLRSLDGGMTLRPATTITQIRVEPWAVGLSWIPMVAADPGSPHFRDRLYMVWIDRRTGRSEVWFTSSKDKGVTWSEPRVVSDDTAHASGDLPNNAHPTVAVNKDGVVAVAWKDRRDSPDGIGFYVRLRASLDGGETWLPSVRVSDVPHRYDPGEWSFSDRATHVENRGGRLLVDRSRRAHLGGHHAGMAAAADGRFFPVWPDNRTGLPQIWTAPVTVRGVVAPHGGGDLASLVDVSDRVTLRMVGTTYDTKTKQLTVRTRLHNISDDTVRGPIIVRALDITSELGSITTTNASNGITRSGATWDFSAVLPEGRLPPQSLSRDRDLEFSLTNRVIATQGKAIKTGALRLNAIILAGPNERSP